MISIRRIGSLVLSIFALAINCPAAVQLPANQCQVRATEILRSDDDEIWQLTVETRRPTDFCLAMKGRGGGGQIHGRTETSTNAIGLANAQIYISITQMRVSQTKSAMIKVVMKSGGTLTSNTHEAPVNVKLGKSLVEPLPEAPLLSSLNTPFTLGTVDGHTILLFVGGQAQEWRPQIADEVRSATQK